MNSITRRVTSLVVAGAILTGGAGAALAQCATPTNANANRTSTQAPAQRGGTPAVPATFPRALPDTLVPLRILTADNINDADSQKYVYSTTCG